MLRWLAPVIVLGLAAGFAVGAERDVAEAAQSALPSLLGDDADGFPKAVEPRAFSFQIGRASCRERV